MSQSEEILDDYFDYDFDENNNNEDLEVISNLNVVKRMKEKIKDTSELIFMNMENTF